MWAHFYRIAFHTFVKIGDEFDMMKCENPRHHSVLSLSLSLTLTLTLTCTILSLYLTVNPGLSLLPNTEPKLLVLATFVGRWTPPSIEPARRQKANMIYKIALHNRESEGGTRKHKISISYASLQQTRKHNTD